MVCGNGFVRQHDLLSAVFLALRSLESLSRCGKRSLLCSVENVLASGEFLTCGFQRLVCGNGFISNHQLLGAVFLALRSLESLGGCGQVGLLCTVKLVLTRCKFLLRFLECLVGGNCFVSNHYLLSTVKHGLAGLE